MVVLAPGRGFTQTFPDVLEGPGRLLPVRIGQGTLGGGQELEFILRNIMDLRFQLEELRRRLDDRPHRVQVIELGDTHPVADVLPVSEPEDKGSVVFRPGMTMADVEREAINAALTQHQGNRRKAAETLGIGERTLYRKIKAYKLE
jgi:transcriptional regulator of acetoin/glycerol metabolism